jgi:transposase
VGTCIAVGLVGGEAFSIDASLIKAGRASLTSF